MYCKQAALHRHSKTHHQDYKGDGRLSYGHETKSQDVARNQLRPAQGRRYDLLQRALKPFPQKSDGRVHEGEEEDGNAEQG